MMWFLIFTAYGLLLWMGMYLLARDADNIRARTAGVLLAVVALAVAAVLLQLPPRQVAGLWSIPLIALALLGLGLYTARREALESGEALWPDLLRSFDYSFFTALLFGGQVALVIWQATGLTRPMLLLLLLTVGSAITLQVWATPLASLLDRIALAHLPQLRQERALLRAESNARTRLAPSSPLELPEEEFARPNNHRQELTPAQQEALAWFREQVPQRTLYNWQKDAAHLVAQHWREQVVDGGLEIG